MDWTFLVLSIGVAVLASVVIPRTTRNIFWDVVIHVIGFSVALIAMIYIGGPTWTAYKLMVGFLLGTSVWIIVHRRDD